MGWERERRKEALKHGRPLNCVLTPSRAMGLQAQSAALPEWLVKEDFERECYWGVNYVLN